MSLETILFKNKSIKNRIWEKNTTGNSYNLSIRTQEWIQLKKALTLKIELKTRWGTMWNWLMPKKRLSMWEEDVRN